MTHRQQKGLPISSDTSHKRPTHHAWWPFNRVSGGVLVCAANRNNPLEKRKSAMQATLSSSRFSFPQTTNKYRYQWGGQKVHRTWDMKGTWWLKRVGCNKRRFLQALGPLRCPTRHWLKSLLASCYCLFLMNNKKDTSQQIWQASSWNVNQLNCSDNWSWLIPLVTPITPFSKNVKATTVKYKNLYIKMIAPHYI